MTTGPRAVPARPNRHRNWDTRVGTIDLVVPRVRSSSYLPSWLLERRRRAEQALILVALYLPKSRTDQYDLGMEYTGYVEPDGYDRVVFRGDPARREFIAFWTTAEGRVLAGMNVNIWDVTDAIRELVRSGRTVDLARLADPQVPLAEL